MLLHDFFNIIRFRRQQRKIGGMSLHKNSVILKIIHLQISLLQQNGVRQSVNDW